MRTTSLLTLAVAGAGICASAVERPNVILIMADDLGWGDTGFNGSKTIKTPHLDQMAKDGLVFSRFYSASAVSSPTRASCLTGRNPNRTGVFHANTGILRPEEITIAELLGKEGYNTGHFGKWHLGTLTDQEKDANRGKKGNSKELNPPNLHGFQTFFSTESKVPTWDPMLRPVKGNIKMGWKALKEGEKSIPYGTHYWTPTGKVTDFDSLKGDDSRVIMDQAIPFIEKSVKAKKNFFSVIWFHTPHLPCVAGPEYAAMYKDKGEQFQNYAGCITAMDDQIGRLRAKLKQIGADQNTMIWFCSDNGPENKTPGTSGGLRARKRSLYEGGIRVPGVMVWPAKVKAGSKTSEPAFTSDYLPTVIDAIDVSYPDKRPIDGVSLMPLLERKPFARGKTLNFAFYGQQAVMAGDYKVYLGKGGKAKEFYNVTSDRAEKSDLSAKKSAKFESLMKNQGEWLKSCEQSFMGEEYGTKSFDRLKQRWIYSSKKKKSKK